jgi:hypothetical protein
VTVISCLRVDFEKPPVYFVCRLYDRALGTLAILDSHAGKSTSVVFLQESGVSLLKQIQRYSTPQGAKGTTAPPLESAPLANLGAFVPLHSATSLDTRRDQNSLILLRREHWQMNTVLERTEDINQMAQRTP